MRRRVAGLVLIVVNDPAFLCSHRLPVAHAAREAGYLVHIATGPGSAARDIKAAGFTFHALPLSRSGAKPLAEGRCIWALCRLFHRLSPDLVHLVTPKPVLYGGIAARLAGVPAVVFAISGLGYLFTRRRGVGARLVGACGRWLYRRALAHPQARVIVQHDADRQRLQTVAGLKPEHARLIPGSGVDLQVFSPDAAPEAPPLVVLPARMLVEKGVLVFARAAALLAARGVRVRCVLLGDPDPGNPGSLDADRLRRLADQDGLEWWGHQAEIAPVLARASVVCLPSFYGEGIPKTLVEAAAAGRAVVTTDWPGCRDAVVPNESALLVPPGDAPALADALERLIADPDRRQAMGRRGRQLAEERYGIESVVAAHLAVYRELCAGGGRS